jgi:hypothetical protein
MRIEVEMDELCVPRENGSLGGVARSVVDYVILIVSSSNCKVIYICLAYLKVCLET